MRKTPRVVTPEAPGPAAIKKPIKSNSEKLGSIKSVQIEQE